MNKVYSYILLLLSALIVIFIFLSKYVLVEEVLNYLWIYLFLISFTQLLIIIKPIYLSSEVYKKVKGVDFENINIQKLRPLIVFIIIVLIIYSSLYPYYYLGGDDTRLYFIYPKEFLNNFVLNIGSNSSLSSLENYLPPISIASFSIIMVLLKMMLPFINLQSLLYSVNILLGLLYFYKLLKYTSDNKNNKINPSFLLASVMFVSSIFNAYVLYNSKLLAIFLVSTFPLSVYLFIKGIKESKPYLIFIVAIISTVFSFGMVTLPWFMAMLIVSVPFILINLWEDKFKTVKYTLVLIIAVLLLNAHWLVFIPYSSSAGTSSGSDFTSQSYRDEMSDGIRSTASLNRVFYPLLNLYHRQIQINYNWSYLTIFSNWYLKIAPLNLIYFSTIIICGLLIKRKDNKYRYYLGSVIGLIISMYFFTVYSGKLSNYDFGTEFFVFLNEHIPGFVMFRNMYDKFSPAMAFSYALAFGISLDVLTRSINKCWRKHILIFAAFILFLNAKPLVFDEFNKLPVWTTKDIHYDIKTLNTDYLSAMDYIKHLNDNSKILLFPLGLGNNALISSDEDNTHCYIGVSPTLVFSGKNDFAGILSFGSYGESVKESILSGNHDEVLGIFQKLNIKYILEFNDIDPELQKSYIFSTLPLNFYDAQYSDFRKILLGNKIKDFGDRYSLYEINNEYDNELFLIQDQNDHIVIPPNKIISYEKKSNHEYLVSLEGVESGDNLIFLEPFNNNWKILFDDKPIGFVQEKALGYANSWRFDDKLLNGETSDSGSLVKNSEGGYNVNLKIYFLPFRIFYPSSVVSIVTMILISIYILTNVIKNKYREE